MVGKKALRVRYICKIKTAYIMCTHDYGIDMPKTTKHALEIDTESGTTYWRETIEKDMKNIMIVFYFPNNGNTPIGRNQIEVDIVFDIKAMIIPRKAQFVAGGHKNEVPKDSV